MDKVKLGVIGLSRGLHVVREAVNEDNVIIAALCDKDPQRVKEAVESLNSKGCNTFAIYDDYDEMLKSDIDAVFVANYAGQHVPFVIKALEAGKHVLSEIPTVKDVEDARRLKAAVKSHPELKYMAAENANYWDHIKAWKKMNDDGKFGQVVYAEGEYLHSGDFRELAKGKPTGHWREYHPAIKYITHELGPLLYILDDECVSVSCMTPDVKAPYNPIKKAPETGVAMFKTKKGTIIHILIEFGAYVGFAHNYRIIGQRGTIENDRTAKMEESHSFAAFPDLPGSTEKREELPLNMSSSGETSGHGGADLKMLRDFIKCIIEDKEPYLNVDRGIQMSLPGAIAHESSLQGGKVMEIPEI